MQKTLSILILILPLWLRSQVTQKQIEKGYGGKYHYILHNVSDVDSVKLYNTALSKINLDEYRLINKRRTIQFDTGVTIELLSAKELNDKYGKPISPLNKKKSFPLIFYIKPTEAEILIK